MSEEAIRVGHKWNVKLNVLTPAFVWDTILRTATDLEPFRRHGCRLEMLEATTEITKFRVMYGNEALFAAEATRTLNDDWSVTFIRLAD